MYLIGNGPLITREKEHPFYENGAVVIEGKEILAVGPFEVLRETYKEAVLVDAKGKVIMPGLINAHTHIYSAFARGLVQKDHHPKDFLSVLEKTWWHIDRNLTVEETYYSALATFLESIQNGVTTVFDHHASYGEITGSLGAIEKAAEEMGIKACLCYEISDRDGEEKLQEAITESMEFLASLKEKKSDTITGLVGLHASFTLSDATLSRIREANQSGSGYHVHIAEGAYDAIHCQKQYKSSIVKRFYDQGILGEHSIAGHCIHIEPKDLALLKETGTAVVHNPESNMGNGVGAPDILAMLDAGILVGLGTDGYTNDMLESLKVANILQKHRSGNPDRGFMEAAKLLFENNPAIGARHFKRKTGVLKAGYAADVILMDYKPYTPMTEENIDGHVMFGMSGAMCDTTIVDGKILMAHRKFTGIEETKEKEKIQASAKDLWKSL